MTSSTSEGTLAAADGAPQETQKYASMAEQLESQLHHEGAGAWLQAIGTFLVYTVTWGLLSAYGSYQSYYETDLLSSAPSSAIAWIGTVQAFLLSMGGIVTGPIYDRGYIRELLLSGTFLTVFGVMMLSLCTEYYQVLLSQGFCVGLGSAILYTPSIALVASRFSRNRTLAISFVSIGTAIGGIIYPIVFVQLLPKVGFAWVTRILGFLTLFQLLIALAIILPRTKEAAAAARKETKTLTLFDFGALKEPVFVSLCLALFFMFLAFWVPFFLIPTFAQFKLGSSSDLAFYMLVILNAATVVGRVLAGLVIRKFGVPETMFGFTAVTAVMLFGWLGIRSVASFIVWIVLLGVFIAPLAVLAPAIIPLVCPDKNVVGTRMGMAWTACAFGILIGNPLSGALNDLETGTFWKMQVLVAVSMTAGAGFILYVQQRIKK
ncbi:hypothetical protein FQN49_006082 [Arthroderma sp. PD_2]|nr:hypothetical protein FQN49_006082 [Arthroderma sp. PD_2]